METGRICSQKPGKKCKKLIFENIPAPNPSQQIPIGGALETLFLILSIKISKQYL
jgi:hypothetical protein